ncbi:hypothetical protein H0I23_12735 [Cellulophaga sp. HaHaR_3_176]|uniref:fibronectin type III domain-containing protein n=1 Tax=Cellulophaga sp. HaHaR_3_176 TaxID=1942464 RepID=UPI001C2005EB|nr:hypothetical protein [Cellulophaga sp. HaHaR_3_176]QWX83313.1 hypothetical protein H0I23_12735 [Cellulophaga sp. HaHaR_3_176]
MKHLLIIFVLLTSFVKAQDTPSVQVISRTLQNKVLLRWAVDEPSAWKKANEYGFLIERSTISRNGEAVLPIEKKQLLSTPLKPKPLAEWEAIATNDQNAAVIAQALYGDSFTTTTPDNDLGAIYAVSDELDQRFTFSLLAAEQNYEAAKLAGWAFEDTSAVLGENYLYTISVAVPLEDTIKINNGSIYTSLDSFEELPKPIGFIGTYEDRRVILRWNFHLLQQLYTSYSIERSENNEIFEVLNGAPIFNTQEAKDGNSSSLSYTDSIPNNTTFYYRIKGKTAFGETGPVSETVSGKGMESLGFYPRISRKEIPTDSTAILYWEFDEKGNDLITGFEVRRSNSDKGVFETVKNNLTPTDRKTTINGLKRINYFTVVALGKNGVESESYTAMVQPVDSIPPTPPTGITAVMDTTGIIKLNWNKNSEEDLKGYRIFKSNNPDVEFTEITETTHIGELFTDTIPIKNLNKKLYFKLKAEDYRYNRSSFSEILVVDKPDITPPSAPVLTKYIVTNEGVELNWIPSSSSDIASHVIFRKDNSNPANLWEQIAENTNITDSIYNDASIPSAGSYSYTMIAKDKVGLESEPTAVLPIVWNGKEITEDAIKFSGIVDRELRFINLSWKIKSSDVVEYRLYRGIKENDLKLYKTVNGDAKGYNDVALEINTTYWYGLQPILAGGKTTLIKVINLKY